MSGAQLDHGPSKMQKELTFYLLQFQRSCPDKNCLRTDGQTDRRTDGQTDGRRTKGDRISSTGLRPVELKMKGLVMMYMQSINPGPHYVAGNTRVVVDTERRIILIGKIGAGKSQSGNAILGYKYNEVFKAKKALKSVTSEVMYGTSVMNGKRYRVYDTPGALNPDDKELFSEQLLKCIYCTSPGFHCLTVVISVAERPNKEDLQLYKNLKKYLGDRFQEHAVIIFTKVEDKAELDDILAPADCPEINELIRSCGRRYICFGEDRKGVKQEFVDQYHEMLEELIKDNVRHKMDFYKHPLYDKAQDFIAKDAKEIRKNDSTISESQALELARERAINGESDCNADMKKEIKRWCPCSIL
ncbi:hypothetical protein FSP39_020509 [Pinctada imbricata]|uniref:AIG1-type G domain-containing protein n=1 Tax=Pinctada imbricata TaxID=66713 RepID=A0AA88XWL9_PINIB|nr:hypothetical protein FSP39_020509 [Pinctada imbricata]